MGWTFLCGASRRDVIDDLTEERSTDGRVFRTLRKCFRGNTMYALHESGKPGETEKWICVYLLAKNGKYGWGYKDISEEMGPVQMECPVSYLDEADPPPNEYAAKWREDVRKLAAQRAKIRPKVGQRWRLKVGCSPREVEIVSLRPLRGTFQGGYYRLKRRLLLEEVSDDGENQSILAG